MDLFNYFRRETTEVNIGAVPLGGPNSIRIQSMTNTSTQDTQACVEQAKRIVDAGGEYVRLTTQGIKEAENLKNINIGLRSQEYMVPLVADVHFNPKVADVAARYAEKVRINPGNYVDAARTFKKLEYTDEEYAQEIQKIHDRFVPFLNICKENHTAIRIGVNHGSLSDRIMSRYGDTPEGMVESCMEFLRICVDENFTDVVISIKASNTVVMVKTVRLLVAVMEKEGMAFPLHLGVTEAKSHHRKDIYKSGFHKYRQRTHHQPPHSKKLLPYHDRYNQHEHKNSPSSIFPDNRKSSVRLFLYLPMFDKNHSECYGLHHLHTYFE